MRAAQHHGGCVIRRNAPRLDNVQIAVAVEISGGDIKDLTSLGQSVVRAGAEGSVAVAQSNRQEFAALVANGEIEVAVAVQVG